MPHQCTQCGTTFADGSKEMLSGCPDCGNNKFQYDPGSVEDAGTSGGDTDSPTSSPDADPVPDRSTGQSVTDRDGGVTDRVNRATKTVREWVGTESGAGNRRSDGESTPSSAEDAPVASGEASDGEAPVADNEDIAQASARSDVVDPDELPERDSPTDSSAGESQRHEPAAADSDTDESTGATPGSTGGTHTGPETAPSPDDAGGTPDEGGTATVGQGAATPTDENVMEAPDDDTPDLDELREELNQQFESIKIVEPGQYELNLMELYDRQEYIISLKEDGRYAIEVPETWRDDDV